MKAKYVVLSLSAVGLLLSWPTRQEEAPAGEAFRAEVVRFFTVAVNISVKNGVVVKPLELESIMGTMQGVKERGLLPLLERISTLGETIPEEYSRCKIIGWAIEQMASLDLDRALLKARQVPRCNQQAWLRIISNELAIEAPTSALPVAEMMEDPVYKAHASIVMARYLASTDLQKSREILENARSLLESRRLLESHRRLPAWGYLPVDPRETLELLIPVRDLGG